MSICTLRCLFFIILSKFINNSNLIVNQNHVHEKFYNIDNRYLYKTHSQFLIELSKYFLDKTETKVVEYMK